MAELYDIAMVDGIEHIVSETKGNSISQTMPLQDYVMMCRVVNIGGECLTIRELVDREMENIRKLSRTPKERGGANG
jgi:hypothetical protein